MTDTFDVANRPAQDAIAGTEERRRYRNRNGIRILPEQVASDWPAERRLPPIADRPPAEALDEALRAIAERYGTPTMDVATRIPDACGPATPMTRRM